MELGLGLVAEVVGAEQPELLPEEEEEAAGPVALAAWALLLLAWAESPVQPIP